VKVILRQDVDKVGPEGKVADVKDGYARNFLIPRGMAVEATPQRLKNIEHEQKLIDDRKKREMKEASGLANRIEQASCTLYARVGEEDKIFGTITTADIAQALEAKGIEVDRKKITLDEPIRALGVYTARVKVGHEVNANLKVWVEKRRDD